MRGYCDITHKFKDCLLRILDVGELGDAGAPAGQDALWQAGGSAVLTARYAKLFYVLKRLGLLGDAAQLPGRSQHIVVINKAETAAALEKANFAP